jgi:hypothetical protein
MQMKLLGIPNVDFDVIDQRLVNVSISGRYWSKNGNTWVSKMKILNIFYM